MGAGGENHPVSHSEMWGQGLLGAIALTVLPPSYVSSELAPLSFIPQELIEIFHPWVKDEKTILPGVVERKRRELTEDEEGVEIPPDSEYEDVFKISRNTLDPESGFKSEEVCMYIKTRAKFVINFETRPSSLVEVDTKTYQLPEIPQVNGTCALETETSKIFLFWSGFNFSIEFIKNPEGNSYYMNRMIIVYDTSHPDLVQDFENAMYKGKIHLETRPGKNFFFTPLGQSYICMNSLDQGPLKLFNIKREEIEGSVDLWETRFQPFVARAGGIWGKPKRCLPHEIREMREDFWPFVSAAFFFLSSGLLLGAYAIKRTWFTDQKVDYGTYDEANRAQQQEMEFVRQPSEPGYDDGTEEVPLNEPVEEAKPSIPVNKGGANPFQQKASNPFQKAANPFN